MTQNGARVVPNTSSPPIHDLFSRQDSKTVNQAVGQDIRPQIPAPSVKSSQHQAAKTGDEQMRPAPGSNVRN
jgi:hypothetical protein